AFELPPMDKARDSITAGAAVSAAAAAGGLTANMAPRQAKTLDIRCGQAAAAGFLGREQEPQPGGGGGRGGATPGVGGPHPAGGGGVWRSSGSGCRCVRRRASP